MSASPRSASRLLAAALCLAASFSAIAAVDALATLNDAAVFTRVQKDVAVLPRAELDALAQAVTTCSSVSIGQRQQQFECERGINYWWARYNRGRDLDNYLASLGALFTAFDNNASNPSAEMTAAYRHAADSMLSLTRSINERFQKLDKS
jgi:HAMP domain-containing protein